MAETLAALGHEAAWIVHGMGLDELTVAGQNHVTALHGGKIASFVVEPEDAGLSRAPIAAIRGGDAGFNASALEAVLQGAPGAYRDTVLLNAAAALIVAGRRAICAKACPSPHIRSHPEPHSPRWRPCGGSAP